jgi:succinate dehydrogenase/fumarate reductase-like Fe-S protein
VHGKHYTNEPLDDQAQKNLESLLTDITARLRLTISLRWKCFRAVCADDSEMSSTVGMANKNVASSVWSSRVFV